MAYSAVGLIALVITIIVNFGVFKKPKFKKDLIPARKYYRIFLVSVCCYYVFDAGWGLFDALHNGIGLYIDTYLYFVAVAVSVFMWSRYTVEHMGEKNHFSNLLIIFGWMFVSAQMVLLLINLFVPIMFKFDADNNYAYVAGGGRHVSLIIQIIIFVITGIYSFLVWNKRKESGRSRYLAIVLCCSAMAILLGFQFAFPLLPLYSLGYLVGTTFLHTFVLEGGKDDYRKTLEEAIANDKKHQDELEIAQLLVSTDPLTGVKSKHAYVETEIQYDTRIGYGNQRDFSLVVFDLNDLKEINDTYGHEAGDKYLQDGVKAIKDIYKHSTIFRVGGDEFVALLEAEDFIFKEDLIEKFNRIMDKNVIDGKVVVSAGMADYDKRKDFSLGSVFFKADKTMYERKKELKDKRSKIKVTES